jgi:hypothetical protein
MGLSCWYPMFKSSPSRTEWTRQCSVVNGQAFAPCSFFDRLIFFVANGENDWLHDRLTPTIFQSRRKTVDGCAEISFLFAGFTLWFTKVAGHLGRKVELNKNHQNWVVSLLLQTFWPLFPLFYSGFYSLSEKGSLNISFGAVLVAAMMYSIAVANVSVSLPSFVSFWLASVFHAVSFGVYLGKGEVPLKGGIWWAMVGIVAALLASAWNGYNWHVRGGKPFFRFQINL